MHVLAADVDSVELAQGVQSRTLLEPSESKPEGVGVMHTTLKPGSEMVFDKPMTEYLHYVISGCIGFGGLDGDLLPSNTAIFIPCVKAGPDACTSKHVIAQTGESETRILTVECKVTKPAFSWAKRLDRNLYHVPQYHSGLQITGQTKILKEDKLMLMGSSRIHCVKVQSQSIGTTIPPYKGPEEIMYQLSSRGELMSGGKNVKTRPGYFVYTPKDELHGINNVHEKFPLQYVLIELVEHTMLLGGA